MTTLEKQEIRKLAKKKFNIPKGAWINVFLVNETQCEISYIINRAQNIERRELLTIEK